MNRLLVAAGLPGTGKSRFGMDADEPIEFWDMENKNEEMRKVYYPNKLINRKDILVLDDEFHDDYYGTYLSLETEIDKVIEKGKKVRDARKVGKQADIGFEFLVIDGISFIRNKCGLAKWLHDHSKEVTNKPSRKKPNKFEWNEIDTDVRNLLFPLINMTVAGIIPNLLFTAEFKEAYGIIDVFDEEQKKIIKQSVKIGREPAYPDYLGYKLFTLLEFYSDSKTGKYKVVCTKSLDGIWNADATDRNVFDVMVEEEQKLRDNKRKQEQGI